MDDITNPAKPIEFLQWTIWPARSWEHPKTYRIWGYNTGCQTIKIVIGLSSALVWCACQQLTGGQDEQDDQH